MITDNKVLVFRFGYLGDTLVAIPAIRRIRKHFPTAQLTLLSDIGQLGPNNPQSILKDLGIFDSFICYSSRNKNLFTKISEIINIIYKIFLKFDYVIFLSPSQRDIRKLRRDRLFFTLCGIFKFVGFDKDAILTRGNLIDGKGIHKQEGQYLVELLGNIDNCDPLLRSEFILNHIKKERINDVRFKKIINNVNAYPMISFGIGGKLSTQKWPIDRYISLLNRILEHYNVFPTIIGGVDDITDGSKMIDGIPHSANLCGIFSIEDSSLVLSNCAFHIGNDTGTMHLAASVGIPCIMISSARNFAGEWDPFGKEHIIIRKNVPCAGCRLSDCIIEGHKCIRDISVTEVFEQCVIMLSNINISKKI